MKVLRIFFKIILFPISLVLTIVVAVSEFLIEKCAIILNIFSFIFFLGAIASWLQYFFAWPFGEAGESFTLTTAIAATVASFLLSPYGLPTFVAWIVSKLDDLNDLIKSI